MLKPKSDPYTHFKDDDQRRRALNYRACCSLLMRITTAIALIAVCALTGQVPGASSMLRLFGSQ